MNNKDINIKSMTSKKPWVLILGFALPLMLGNIFQQLYTFTDTMVVGKALGYKALAALGATEWLVFMVFGFIQGLTHGFSIVLSHRFGSKDYLGLRKAFINAVYIIIIFSAVLTISGQIIIFPILKLINAPGEIIELSRVYLQILFLGIPVVMSYNLFAAILRALGNSKTPLHAMIISSVCNVILDIIFVFVLNWGIKGVAFATIIAQILSSLYCFAAIRKIEILRLEEGDTQIDINLCIKQIKLGLPMGALNVVTAAGGLVVQSVVNGFGIIFIAGFTAANKLYGLLEIAASSYGYAIATYTGQNFGAGLISRIRKGLKAANIIGTLTALVMSAIMLLLGKPILSLFVSGDKTTVSSIIQTGYHFLTVLSIFFPLLYILYIMRSCLQGMGKTISPLLSSITQLIMRVLCAVILTSFIGEKGVFYGEIFAWIGADIILVISYYVNINKTPQKP